MDIKLYIIELKSGALYVGQSTNPLRRFFEHQSGKGAIICRKDKPVRLLKEFETKISSTKIATALENLLTIEMMRWVSSGMVWGGYYCSEEYRLCNKSWKDQEIERLRQWLYKITTAQQSDRCEEFRLNFITWVTEVYPQIKKYVES